MSAESEQLRCDVEQNPFSPCSRCLRHKLDCKIDSGFKRIGKRSRHAEIERRIVELEAENQNLREQLTYPRLQHGSSVKSEQIVPNVHEIYHNASYGAVSSADNAVLASDEAVASLMRMKNGADNPIPYQASGSVLRFQTLGQVIVTEDQIEKLFQEYFDCYHHYLPFLNPDRSAQQYLALSPLLFWTIVCTAARRFQPDAPLLQKLIEPLSKLLWSTVADVPQDYHVVKALCLLCTWPLPTSRSSSDPTFMLAGLMMHIALQVGLHRPSHAQEFSRKRVHLEDDEIQDRAKTWVACIVVAQKYVNSLHSSGRSLQTCTIISALTFNF
jgi:hypothetical protein